MTNGWFDFCKMARPRSGKLTRTQCCKVSSERKVIKSHIGRLQLYSYIFYKLTVIIKLRTLIVYCLPRLTHFSVMLTVLTNLDCPQFLCSVFKFYIQVLVKFFTHVFYNNLLSIFLPLPTIYSDFYQFQKQACFRLLLISCRCKFFFLCRSIVWFPIMGSEGPPTQSKYFGTSMLERQSLTKGQLIQKCLHFLSKTEQKQVEFVCSVFGRNVGFKK